MTQTVETKRGAEAREGRRVRRTTLCVVGGGPGGAVLAYLMARAGVDVVLLEAHPDFDREFRGDTLHPSAMEIMDDLGLADRLLRLRHTKIRNFTLQTASGPFSPIDLRTLRTKYPYITLMPQSRFIEFMVEEAGRYPHFEVVMSARVKELIEEDGVVRGVRYEGRGGAGEVRALLTVGADGRGSRVRRLAGFEPQKTSPPMDVMWFRLPREEGDPEGLVGRIGRGHIAIMLDRYDHWQAGYVIPKGTFPELRAAGIEALHSSFAELIPEYADRIRTVTSWREVSLLSVESSMCPKWYRPGLLLIGDAAHVMSPVAGVGINYAIQDAVVAANILAEPLKEGRRRLRDVPVRHLAAVQRRREWPTRFIQGFQALVQRRVLAPALRDRELFRIPLPLRLVPRVPILRALPARIVGFGLLPVRVRS